MKFIVYILLFGVSLASQGQGTNTFNITDADSLLFSKIQTETDPDKIHQHVIDLILLSDDKAPLALLEEAKKLYELSQSKKDLYSETVALSFYGQGFRITGDFSKAQQYHFKAIESSKKEGNKSLIGYVINQSAHIYKDREENEKAVSLYKQSIEYTNAGPVETFKFYPIMNLGFVYLNTSKTDSALYYSSNSVRMLVKVLETQTPAQRAIMERSLYVYCLTNLAGSYSRLNHKMEADSIFGKAAAIISKYKDVKTRYFQFFYSGIARHYQRYNLVDSELYAAKKAIASVSGTPVSYLASGPAKILSDYYEHVNADSTVKYLKIFLQGNEVMNSTRVTQQLQIKTFEEEQRSEEIKRAEKSYRDKIIVYLLAGGLMALFLFAVYMYRSNRARTRINDELQKQKDQVEKALAELKSAQAQLIQSEKMASLGELTAGIAHEIQNPLNFVNNFSEVNTELSDELKSELAVGNFQVANEIAGNLKENSEKINHHGKRADAIVKGMLQHSRSSSGVKEPTDINALCDEYLRLAYHGLRAKDKTFNAKFETSFDESIGKINIVPQDIGRVFLNLINNAFYAVSEKVKSSMLNAESYEPIVTISTVKRNGKVEIKVKDNGNGIPQKILDKIFQPFFTTKPTGQGTGLGLSLAYDIITKGHGGELKVGAMEGEGTTFIIQLPGNIS
jgi:signal transduction histidine kinase